eukprot:8881680-Lingulodinium_polyedra.AAC.1
MSQELMVPMPERLDHQERILHEVAILHKVKEAPVQGIVHIVHTTPNAHNPLHVPRQALGSLACRTA